METTGRFLQAHAASFFLFGPRTTVELVPLIWSAAEPANTLRALKAFKEDYPEASPCLLYRGQEEIRIGDAQNYWLLENATTGKPFSTFKALYLRVIKGANCRGVSPNGLFTEN